MPRLWVVRTEYTLPWSPTDRDICMDRTPVYDPEVGEIVGVVERYNIPLELEPIEGTGFGWGPDVGGGLTLALNLLDRWIDRRPGDTASFFGRPLPCRQLCLDLMADCYLEWIRPIGWHGGVLHGGELGRWIAARVRLAEVQGIDLAEDAPGEEPTPTTLYGG